MELSPQPTSQQRHAGAASRAPVLITKSKGTAGPREAVSSQNERKRVRASNPKVRSGCKTCKARRVKCDERKPSCVRCEDLGRICGGYSMRPLPKMLQLQPRIPSLTLHSPSLSPHRTAAEDRYFEIFRERTAFELSGFYDNPFWHVLVLQESLKNEAIRHAVIALGALNESMRLSPPPNLKVNIVQAMDPRHHTHAIQSYQTAVHCLNHYISTSPAPQLRLTLIACLLFITLETIQGSFASSVQQTYGGLKILRNYYVGKPGSRPWIPKKLTSEKRAKMQAEEISKRVLNNLGCDGVYGERAMIMHVEEYLDGLHETPTASTAPKPFVEQTRRRINRPLITDNEAPLLEGYVPDAVQRRIDEERVFQAVDLTRTPSSSSRTPSHASSSLDLVAESTSPKGSRRSMVASPLTLTPATMPGSSNDQSPTSPTSAEQAINLKKRKRPLEQRSPTPPNKLQNDQYIEESIFQSFVRLDGQGLFFGMVPGIPPLIWDIHSTWHLTIPASFSNFEEAQRCWDFLMDRALQFYRRTLFNAAYNPNNAQTKHEIHAQHKLHTDQLLAFAVAFKPILKAAISPSRHILNPAALVLSLYQNLTSIMLGRITHDSELVYDAYLAHFRRIVATAALLLSREPDHALPRNPRFSFDIGLVPPLHVAATRCRDPVVRRQAIALLFKSPRQEGMWDGIVSARAAAWLVRQEEDGLPPPRLPPGLDLLAAHDVRHGYPSPPPSLLDESRAADMLRVSDMVHMESEHELGGSVGAIFSPRAEPGRRAARGEEDDGEAEREGWTVPLEKRIQLMVVDFHVPKRNMQIRCQRVVPDAKGNHEQMATVIGW